MTYKLFWRRSSLPQKPSSPRAIQVETKIKKNFWEWSCHEDARWALPAKRLACPSIHSVSQSLIHPSILIHSSSFKKGRQRNEKTQAQWRSFSLRVDLQCRTISLITQVIWEQIFPSFLLHAKRDGDCKATAKSLVILPIWHLRDPLFKMTLALSSSKNKFSTVLLFGPKIVTKKKKRRSGLLTSECD